MQHVLSKVLLFADDVTLAVAHNDLTEWIAAANAPAQGTRNNLSRLGFQLSSPKSFNLVVSPGYVVVGVLW